MPLFLLTRRMAKKAPDFGNQRARSRPRRSVTLDAGGHGEGGVGRAGGSTGPVKYTEAFGHHRSIIKRLQLSQGFLGGLRKRRACYQANFATKKDCLVLEFGRSGHQ